MPQATHLKDSIVSFCTRVWNARWTIVEWVLLFVLLVFVPLGLVSLPLSIEWQAQDLARRSETMTLADGKTLSVDYPAIVLIDDQPALFSFSLHQPITQPLTVTVQLDRALLLAVPPQTYRDDAPVLTFQPLASRVQTQTLTLANARLVGGLQQTGTITLTVTGGSSPETKLSVQVEGTLRAALRGFVGNSLNWIVTALLSAAGLVFTQFEKRREAEEKKKEAEEKKKEKEIEEKRELAKQGQERFRSLMQKQNAPLAQELLDELEKQGLIQYLAPADLAWMHRLIDWSKGNLAELDFKNVPSDWLDAAAGALVFARENGLGNDQVVLSALRQLPVDKLSSRALQDAVQNPIKLPEQAEHWPHRPAEPNWDLIALNPPWQDRLGTNPYPYEYAEDDVTLLFSQKVSVFWYEHPLYRRLARSDKSEIIAGEAGTGKTAIALALGEYLHGSETLACYLSGLPEEHEMQRALARKILDFVCWHPTFLRKLGQDSRGLLARVCADVLGDHVVLVALDSAPIEEMDFIKDCEGEERTKRERIVRSQLRLFRETVVSLPAREHLSHCDWYGALAQCARLLGFQLPIRVVIDASGGQCAEWINKSILSRLRFWRMDGIIVKVFVPASVSNAIQFPEDHSGWLVFSKLEWDAYLLTQMLEHRFKNTMAARNSRLVRPEVVDDSLWNRMIENAKNNPRGFIRLWNRMLAIASGILDKTVFEKALEGLECP